MKGGVGSPRGQDLIGLGVFLAAAFLIPFVAGLVLDAVVHTSPLFLFAGLFLAGFALLTPLGLAGAAIYVAAHGLLKGALFLCVGIVLHRLGSVNETWLHGRGRGRLAGHARCMGQRSCGTAQR